MRRVSTIWLMVTLSAFVLMLETSGQERPRTRPRRVATAPPAAPPAGPPDRDLDIAAQFAPIIHQGLDGSPRFDYITNFTFDGDWRGDNNWENADKHPLRAYVYYSVIETDSHYFVHYALFHPRDYKGGLFQSWLLEEVLRVTKDRTKNLPPEVEDLTLSHENDLEGCLVVAEKREGLNAARVVYVETLAHNEFQKYQPGSRPGSIGYEIDMEGSHPKLFCEPKGHGVTAYTDRPTQLKDATRGVLIYHHTGQPEDPEQAVGNRVGYRLAPIYGTLWQQAQAKSEETYGETIDYGTLTVRALEKGLPVEKQSAIGPLGAAFRGKVGAENKARPPWAWFDFRERTQPRGEWFFDPAATVKRHFYLYNLSTAYVHNPYLQIWREGNGSANARE